MESQNSKIELYGIKPSRGLVSFIQRRVEKWIEREQSLLFLPKEKSYEVKIDGDDSDSILTCSVQIKIGSKRWWGHAEAKTVQNALLQAMDHLQCSSVLPLCQTSQSILTPVQSCA